MALRIANRVTETSTTTGQGTLNLAGAKAGFQTFVNGIGTTNTCYYEIDDGTDWEVGLGTVTSGSPDTLSRDVLIESTNATTFVNWSAGEKDVRCVLPAAQYRARATLSSVQSIPSGSATDITWTNGEEDYDDGDWHDGASNAQRFTVPDGAAGRIVHMTGSVRLANAASGNARRIQLRWYSSASAVKGLSVNYSPPDATPTITFLSGSALFGPVATGDYFVMQVFHDNGSSINVEATNNNTYVAVEALMP